MPKVSMVKRDANGTVWPEGLGIMPKYRVFDHMLRTFNPRAQNHMLDNLDRNHLDGLWAALYMLSDTKSE